MDIIFEIAITFLLVVGGIFGLVGSYGLVKLPDAMTRLHAPTKAATVGVGGVLCASLLWFAYFGDHVSYHEFLIILLIFLTAPITGLMIAKANLHLNYSAQELPSPGEGQNWATFDDGAIPVALLEPESQIEEARE